MNESCSSFASVEVRLRPAQNTSQRSNGPPRRTGVSAVSAVAFPSTLATEETLSLTELRFDARPLSVEHVAPPGQRRTASAISPDRPAFHAVSVHRNRESAAGFLPTPPREGALCLWYVVGVVNLAEIH